MIKKFSDYDKIQVYEGGLSLEPGGYELRILGAKVEDFTNCSILKIRFDVINHAQYANIFSDKYKSAKVKDVNAKWANGGIFDVFLPKDDGSEQDGYTKQNFKRFTTSVENSNQGYNWNWDEQSLVGKVFGGVFGREQFKTDKGELKFAVKCRFARSIDSIRTGDFKIPEDKLIKTQESSYYDNPYRTTPQTNSNTATNNDTYSDLSDYEEILSDGDVPF